MYAVPYAQEATDWTRTAQHAPHAHWCFQSTCTIRAPTPKLAPKCRLCWAWRGACKATSRHQVPQLQRSMWCLCSRVLGVPRQSTAPKRRIPLCKLRSHACAPHLVAGPGARMSRTGWFPWRGSRLRCAGCVFQAGVPSGPVARHAGSGEASAYAKLGAHPLEGPQLGVKQAPRRVPPPLPAVPSDGT